MGTVFSWGFLIAVAAIHFTVATYDPATGEKQVAARALLSVFGHLLELLW